jgi:hypothetical protein
MTRSLARGRTERAQNLRCRRVFTLSAGPPYLATAAFCGVILRRFPSRSGRLRDPGNHADLRRNIVRIPVLADRRWLHHELQFSSDQARCCPPSKGARRPHQSVSRPGAGIGSAADLDRFPRVHVLIQGRRCRIPPTLQRRSATGLNRGYRAVADPTRIRETWAADHTDFRDRAQ